MAEKIGPDPGFTFVKGAERGGKEWITELIRIVQLDATTQLRGRVLKMPAQSDSTAATVADLKTDFNTLLAALRTAGMMEN